MREWYKLPLYDMGQAPLPADESKSAAGGLATRRRLATCPTGLGADD
jgi:hypothetical protein